MANATNTMLCWNVDTKAVALVPWPDTAGFSQAYNRSALACYREVRGSNYEIRQATVLAEGMILILREKIPPQTVHEVLLGLEEYVSAMPPEMQRPLSED